MLIRPARIGKWERNQYGRVTIVMIAVIGGKRRLSPFKWPSHEIAEQNGYPSMEERTWTGTNKIHGGGESHE